MLTQAEVVQAATALDNWFDSQGIKGGERVIVMATWMAVELVSVGQREDRIALGEAIVLGMIKQKVKEIYGMGKKDGIIR